MRKTKKFRNIIFLIAVLIFAIIAVSGYLLYNKPHRDVMKTKADFAVSAPELLKEFEANPAATAEKFNGKILLVTGKVESMNITPTTSSIQFSGEEGFYGVNCSFNSSDPAYLLKIKIGAEIQIKGECSGYIDDVILNNCFLIE